MRRALLAVLVASAACHGPKGSPDSSVKSFYAAADSQDWSAMASITSEQSIRKIGSAARMEAHLANEFGGWRDFEISIDDWSITGDGRQAMVTFTCRAVGLNYRQQETNVDCSDSFPLVKEGDDRWHIVLPGTTRLKAIQ